MIATKTSGTSGTKTIPAESTNAGITLANRAMTVEFASVSSRPAGVARRARIKPCTNMRLTTALLNQASNNSTNKPTAINNCGCCSNQAVDDCQYAVKSFMLCSLLFVTCQTLCY